MPPINRFRTGIAAIAIALLTGACVMIKKHDYPSTWPPVARTEGRVCPDLTGAYPDSNGTEWLSDAMLWKGFPAEAARANHRGTRVELLSVSDALLRVTVWQGEQVVQTRDLQSDLGEFSCTPDGLEIKDTDYIPGMPGAVQRELFAFARAADGGLVMKRRTRAGGLHVFLPLIVNITYWERWGPYDQP